MPIRRNFELFCSTYYIIINNISLVCKIYTYLLRVFITQLTIAYDLLVQKVVFCHGMFAVHIARRGTGASVDAFVYTRS